MFNQVFKKISVMLLGLIVLLALAGIASAAQLTLLTHGSNGSINGGFFQQIDPEHSTGTGNIDPFLHIQANGIEQGYNTDYRPIEFQDANSPWTRSLLLSDVPIVNIGGTDYREFLLDVNENSGGSNEFISLDKLQIFIGNSGSLTNYTTGGLGTLIWDMDIGADGDSWIELDYSLEAGSGDGDMLAYIPNSLFTGQGSYLYLYSMFGAQGTAENGLGSCDGFEEWAVREAVVPEPSSILALSTGLISLVGLGKRRITK